MPSPSTQPFTDWIEVWQDRAGDFNAAVDDYPDARLAERETFLDGLAVEPGQSFLDVAAAGGYLLKGVRNRLGPDVRILAIEPSPAHAASLPDYATVADDSTITSFSLGDASVDRVANLSGLHHTEDISGYFREAFRVLKPGGRMGAADVRKGSPVDTWLNSIVDRFNPEGHDGRFYEDGAFSAMLRHAGFINVPERRAEYTWDFDSVPDMAAFCLKLFRMTKAQPRQVAQLIDETLGIVALPNGRVGMNWELLQAFGDKPE